MPRTFKAELAELQRGMEELGRREMHPLKVYRPTPAQLPFHESSSSQNLVKGGKRSGKAQPIDEPILTPDGWRDIGELVVGDVVIGGDGSPCVVTGVFPQGIKPVYRTTFSDMTWTRCCGEHMWRIQTGLQRLKKNGDWQVFSTDQMLSAWGPEPKPHERPNIPVCNVWMPSRDIPVDPYLLGVLLGDGSISCGIASFSTADEEIVDSVQKSIPSGLLIHKVKNPKKASYDYRISSGNSGGENSLTASLRLLGLTGKRAWEKHIPNSYIFNTSHVRLEVLRGLMDTDGTVSRSGASFSTTSPQLASGVADLVRSLGGRASLGKWRTKNFTYKGEKKTGRPTIVVTVRMLDKCPFRLSRKAKIWMEWRTRSQEKPARMLRSIKPDGEAECVCISVSCPQQTYVTRDFIVTHNTLAVAMEFASRVLGVPITRPDGTKIPLRYVRPTRKSPRLYWVIGFDIKHIGQTIYHRLFSPGLGCGFRVVNDKKTGQWRAWNRNEEPDREEESVLSPPLIGDHMIVPGSWHMESAAGNIFNSVRLTNGATICAYASTGDHAKQGDAVDGIWIDEDVVNAEFVKEWDDRRISTRGWLLWSVWPHVANWALVKKIQEAKRLEDEPPEAQYIRAFTLIGSENPFSSKEGVHEALDEMGDEDEIAHRDRGDIEGLLGSIRIYDFGASVHALKAKEPAGPKPENVYQLFNSILHRFGRLPREWTRYLAIDPSNTRTGCVVGVVPPTEWEGVEIGNRLIIEKEFVARRHTPQMLAEALANMWGQDRFEAFIMDNQIGRQTTVGNDVTVFESYGKQFAKVGLYSRLTKTSFVSGCKDKQKRRRTVRNLMEMNNNGWPTLFVVENKTPATQKEFGTFQKKRMKINDKMVVVDEAANERDHDMMAATEYLCQYVQDRFDEGNAYMDPGTVAGVVGSGAFHAAQAMKSQLNASSGGYVHFGPGAHA